MKVRENYLNNQFNSPMEKPMANKENTPKAGFWNRLKDNWFNAQKQLQDGLKSWFGSESKTGAAYFPKVENFLLEMDAGAQGASEILSRLKDCLKGEPETLSAETLCKHLEAVLVEKVRAFEVPPKTLSTSPTLLLLVGVNGSGKTSLCGKLAYFYQQQGKKVMLAAGDTFRAAAVAQLQAWGNRLNIPVISQGLGADSASVIFDALQSAKAKGFDLVIADTAGRLQNPALAAELAKLVRVVKKLDPTAPHEALLVLDATLGQNTCSQINWFQTACPLTGLCITKLDSAAKAGFVFGFTNKPKLSIEWLAFGEELGDIQRFNADTFVKGCLASVSVALNSDQA